jgi:type IV fimbrial biogenesis protein FimT
MNRMQGITLLEMLIALVIAAVLAGIAIPTAASAMAKARISGVAMAMTDSFLTSARVAVSTGSAVIICPAPQGAGCDDSVEWSRGWMVYADVDGNRRYDPHDPVIQRAEALAGGLRMYSTQGRRRVVFQSDGGNEGSNVSFTLCADSGEQVGSLVLSNAGRFRLAEPTGRQRQRCEGG